MIQLLNQPESNPSQETPIQKRVYPIRLNEPLPTVMLPLVLDIQARLRYVHYAMSMDYDKWRTARQFLDDTMRELDWLVKNVEIVEGRDSQPGPGGLPNE